MSTPDTNNGSATQTEAPKPKVLFGTAPVFLTAISTILGAIMFLRFGYAVANVGFFGTLVIVAIGHMVTIPTAMAIAEIATNQRVEGGGEYYIISRSFGLNIGAAVGLALFLSQAISVAFYIIAFAQAFDPVIAWLQQSWGITISDSRYFSLPAMGLLTALMLTRGAGSGIKALYVVVGTLAVSLFMFFAGHSSYESEAGLSKLTDTVAVPDNFFLVFAICFPAFTGMTAGVGLSGDLKDPKRSIPLGTLSATLVGMAIYGFIAYKLAVSASPGDLAGDQLIMSRIALWGPIIPIGLAAATISSALGSIMVAPRTLQAIAGDRIFPVSFLNRWISHGKPVSNEPINASIITCAIAFVFVAAGDVDFVARIISMIFMVTYGSICLISFLQHFAADPAYRPVFKSRWYISLLGVLMCVWLMFKMDTAYAALSIGLMVVTYILIGYYSKDKRGMAALLQGAAFQLSRRIQVFLQKAEKEDTESSWRPSVVCLSGDSFKRLAAFEMLRWISYRYGFGTYIHFINGYLSRESHQEAREALDRLIKTANVSGSNVYIDTMVVPSVTSAVAQIVQLPGISGKENNMILMEYAKDQPEVLADIVDNYELIRACNFDMCILASTDKGFAYRSQIDIWISSRDYLNANLMILLGFIILGHPDWKRAQIRLFAAFSEDDMVEQRKELLSIIHTGRLPISPHNITFIARKADTDIKNIITEQSSDASLTIIGFRNEYLKAMGAEAFSGYEGVGNILFVNSTREKEIT